MYAEIDLRVIKFTCSLRVLCFVLRRLRSHLCMVTVLSTSIRRLIKMNLRAQYRVSTWNVLPAILMIMKLMVGDRCIIGM